MPVTYHCFLIVKCHVVLLSFIKWKCSPFEVLQKLWNCFRLICRFKVLPRSLKRWVTCDFCHWYFYVLQRTQRDWLVTEACTRSSSYQWHRFTDSVTSHQLWKLFCDIFWLATMSKVVSGVSVRIYFMNPKVAYKLLIIKYDRRFSNFFFY